MPNKMERFTQTARQTLLLAQIYAEELHAKAIGPEHILVGLCKLEQGSASKILREAGITTESLRQYLGVGSEDAALDSIAVLSDATKKMLELSVNEAVRRFHPEITPLHLLGGILRLKPSQSQLDSLWQHFGVEPETLLLVVQSHYKK